MTNSLGAYGAFVSGWGDPLIPVRVDDTTIADDLLYISAALCKPHSTHIKLVAENGL